MPMSEELTSGQSRVLAWLRSTLEAGRRSPTIREIMHGVGYASPRPVQVHLDALEAAGWIRRTRGVARGIELADALPARGVPLLGDVPAGAPELAEEHLREHVSFDAQVAGADTFALRVRGTSMQDAGILEGDLVVVRKDAPVTDGAIGVALLDGDATVKRIRKTAGGYRLEPENPDFTPIDVPPNAPDFRILGPVVAVWRTLP